MFRFFRRRNRAPNDRLCARCGVRALCGYSDHAESDLEEITPLCLQCLKKQLGTDYAEFEGRAVVVQPAPGPPVYVFQVGARSGIANDVASLLKRIGHRCHDCEQNPKFLWVESRGLTADDFTEVLEKGVSQTLLTKNVPPISLCAACCVERIAKELATRNISYLELCSPKGTEEGLVLPMGY